NQLLMLPFQLVILVAIWSLRTSFSSWLAAAVALWPPNAYYWEFRYDLVPTALLVLGLVLALRERWGWSGLALGVATAAKWTPALPFAALAVGCWTSRRRPAAGRLSGSFALGLLLLYVPFLAWSPENVLAALTKQGGRSISNESIWYFPLRCRADRDVHRDP